MPKKPTKQLNKDLEQEKPEKEEKEQTNENEDLNEEMEEADDVYVSDDAEGEDIILNDDELLLEEDFDDDDEEEDTEDKKTERAFLKRARKSNKEEDGENADTETKNQEEEDDDEDDDDEPEVENNSQPEKTAAKKDEKSIFDDVDVTSKNFPKERLVPREDEYGDDSEEDEGQINTIGSIPFEEWYKEYDIVGYDKDGNPIKKTLSKRDEVDLLIQRHDDPDWWRNVFDEKNQREYKLTDKDVETIMNIRNRMFPPDFKAPEDQDYVDWFEWDPRFPLKKNIHSKEYFQPNKWERRVINKLATLMKNGVIPIPKEHPEQPKKESYLMWDDSGQVIADKKIKNLDSFKPPKTALPDHRESSNPPAEFLSKNNKFQKKYPTLRDVPQYPQFIQERFSRCMDLYMAPRVVIKKKPEIKDPDSLLPELPKPSELRPFPEICSMEFQGHQHIVRKVSVSPNGQYIVTCSNDQTIRLWEAETGKCLRIWNCAEIFASSSKLKKMEEEEEKMKKQMEIDQQNNPKAAERKAEPTTTKPEDFNESASEPLWVEWNPNINLNIFAVAFENQVLLISPPETDINTEVKKSTQRMFPAKKFSDDDPSKSKTETGDEDEVVIYEESDESDQVNDPEHLADKKNIKHIEGLTNKGKRRVLITWRFLRKEKHRRLYQQGVRARLIHEKKISQVTWHHQGNYFVTVSPEPYQNGILMHQLSTRQTQKPFKRKIEHKSQKVQMVLFHPTKPLFIIVHQKGVKIYNLQKQRLHKRLKGAVCRYYSSVAIHPKGFHMLTGGFDKKAQFYELSLTSKPFKVLRTHQKAVRNVQFHKRYPLFATCSDDGEIHIYHCTVPNSEEESWVQDPLIVPVKIIKAAHAPEKDYFGLGLGCLDICWHPTQPWLFSAGSDGYIRLYTA